MRIKSGRETGIALFNCTSQTLCFLKTEGLWQPYFKEFYWFSFFNSICSLPVSVSHLVFLQYYEPSISKKIMTHWRVRWWLAFFSNKVFLMKACTLFLGKCYCVLDRWQYSVNIKTFICTEKPKKLIKLLLLYSLYFSVL